MKSGALDMGKDRKEREEGLLRSLGKKWTLRRAFSHCTTSRDVNRYDNFRTKSITESVFKYPYPTYKI
jgi:hypothetical protein